MKKLLLSLISILFSTLLYSQNQNIEIRPIALDSGIYDSTKVKKNNNKAFHGEEAEKKFFRMVKKNKKAKSLWIYEYKSEKGKIIEGSESEILTYYPDLKIVITTGGHGYTLVDDIYHKENHCGNPQTYVYPHRKDTTSVASIMMVVCVIS